MGIRRENNGTYTGRFKHKGYKSGEVWKRGFPTRAAALAWIVETKGELKNPPPEQAKSISFHSLATRYLDHCESRMAHNTVRAKNHYYRNLVRFKGGDFEAQSLPKIELLEFLQDTQKRKGSKNANNHLKDIKAVYNWGVKYDLIHKSPVKDIDKFPEERFIKYVPPSADINKVLMAAGQEDMDLLMVVYYTGGRIGEVFRLTWDDVNFEKRELTLRTRKRRGGVLEEDKCAMSDRLCQVLARKWKQRDKEQPWVFVNPATGNQYSYSSKRNLMKDLCAKAKVKAFGFHAIRHHVASILEDSGKATIGQIQKFLRHKRMTTTIGYLHTLDRDLVEVAELLDGKLLSNS